MGEISFSNHISNKKSAVNSKTKLVGVAKHNLRKYRSQDYSRDTECFAKFADQTFLFLQHDQMDDFTHNKAIQKICESYRVPKEWKEKLRSLRRRS